MIASLAYTVPVGPPLLILGNAVASVPHVWPAGDPASPAIVRGVDASRLLGARFLASVQAASDVLEVLSADADGRVVSVALRGGTDGALARVELRLICSDGTDESVVVLLPLVQPLTLAGGDAVSSTLTTSTLGATPGALGPLPIYAAVGSSVSVRGSVVARNTNTGDTVSWDVALVVKALGTAQASVSESSILAFEVDAALAGSTLSAVVNGSAVLLAVAGVSGAVMTWSASLTWAVA